MENFNKFTQKANDSLNNAIAVAQLLGHSYVGSEHILIGMVQEGTGITGNVFNKFNVTYEKLNSLIKNAVGMGLKTKLSFEDFTPRAKRVLQLAVIKASQMGSNYISTEHILLALLEDKQSYAIKFLQALGVDIASFEKTLNIQVGQMPKGQANPINNSEKSSGKMLDKFGKDLTTQAKQGLIDPVIGRQKEIERVVQILSRRTKNNPCLVGEPGVGKTAIAEGLALLIANGNIPESLKNKRLISLDLTSMIAGTKYRGDFEERIRGVIDEVTNSDDIILFIDEIHTIVGAGSAEGSSDAANILKPSLARGEFQLIGATTLDEYRKNIEKDSALERRFQPVTVDEPTKEEAILILQGLKDRYEAHHKVKITDEAIESAVELSSRYINDRFLPDKAIDLIDEAGSKVRLAVQVAPKEIKELEERLEKVSKEKSCAVDLQEFEKASKLRDEESELKKELEEQNKQWKESANHNDMVVTSDDIADIISLWTCIPAKQLTQQESARLLEMENILHSRVVGQNEAVSAISRAIRRGRVGLKDKNRPIGSFIFLGPTGVGKTELSKALAEAMFGQESAIIRLDMSEYMEKHTVSKLIGSPPGYVGFDEGGQLTEKIRRKPYSVILFDEIEKAHPDVFNILLQILDDGRLSDSKGRVVDFKNTIIIMTSNIGARAITQKKTGLGFGQTEENGDFNEIKESVMSELKVVFRPEFLNRVDDIIVFNKLNKEEIKTIANYMLNNVAKNLEELKIMINFTDNVTEKIADIGFDPVYGARPLKRTIQQKIEDELAEQMLKGNIKTGDNVVCDFKDDKFVFEK